MTQPELSLESRMKLHDVRNHVHLYTGKRAVKKIINDQLESVFTRSLSHLERGDPVGDVVTELQDGRELLARIADHDQSMDRAFDRIVGIVLSSYDPSNQQVISLAKLVAGEVAYFHSDLRRLPVDRLTFTAHFDPHVRADPQRLCRLIDNLIINASDALFDEVGGIEVAVDLHAVLDPRPGVGGPIGPGNYGTLTVRDEGRGLAPSRVEDAFQAGVTSKSDHAGLGLALVKTVVQECDAGLEVLPVRPHGTMFRVYFPLAETPADPTDDA